MGIRQCEGEDEAEIEGQGEMLPEKMGGLRQQNVPFKRCAFAVIYGL
jgi:hypothetical protein